MKSPTALLIPLLSLVLFHGSVRAQDTFAPKNGFVPDSTTAIKIAVAVWSPIYGEAQIADEKPYHATLKDGVWTVTGSLHPAYSVGGVAFAEISQKDGKILRVIHGK
jgi:hypothetical protein